MRRTIMVALTAAAAFGLLAGCSARTDDRGAAASAAALSDRSSPYAIPTGTRMTVRLASALSSETAHAGDPWSGTTVAAVMVGRQEVIPAGSTVRGVVTGAHPAGTGTRAMLDLAIQDVSTGGEPRSLTAGIEAILAALPEARPGLVYSPAERGDPVVLDSGAELVFVVQQRVASR